MPTFIHAHTVSTGKYVVRGTIDHGSCVRHHGSQIETIIFDHELYLAGHKLIYVIRERTPGGVRSVDPDTTIHLHSVNHVLIPLQFRWAQLLHTIIVRPHLSIHDFALELTVI